MTENNAGRSRLFFDWSSLPSPGKDIALLDSSANEIFMRADAANTDQLAEFSNLSNLYVFGKVEQELFQSICDLKSIRFLYIEDLPAPDLAPLKKLNSLEYLRVDRNTKIERLDDLSGLISLKGLAIEQFRRVSSLAPLANLRNLEELSINGGMNTVMKIDSLRPLEKLTQLSALDLAACQVADRDIRPLAKLKRLRSLVCPNVFSMEAFAWLAGKLPDTECDWLEPYFVWSDDGLTNCDRCGGVDTAVLSGKGKRNLCPSCDFARLRKHIEKFEGIKAASRQGAEDWGN